MIITRNFANFYSGKCDCCKRVRKIKTKLEIIGEDTNTLYGELNVCPSCLPHLNFENNNDIIAPDYDLDEDDYDIADYAKMGYNVQQLL